MRLIEAQISSMITLGLSTMLIGLLPAWFSRQNRQRWPLLVSSLLCFGAGVLLATSFIHMLPEVRKELTHYQQYTELIFCAGFFILYMIDEIVHYFYEESHHDELIVTNNHFTDGPSDGHNCRRRHYGATEHNHLLHHKQPPYNPNLYRTASDSDIITDNRPPSQLCHVGHQEPCNTAPVGKFGLLVALSVHAVIEGLAVGLENKAAQVLLLLGAIATHKLVVGFCLGIELATAPGNTPCKHFTSIAVFSFGSVVGIGLGMTLSTVPKGVSELIMPILQGLAGGTLLYITVSEVLPRERARWHKQNHKRYAGIFQFIAVGIGFTVMTLLIKFLDF